MSHVSKLGFLLIRLIFAAWFSRSCLIRQDERSGVSVTGEPEKELKVNGASQGGLNRDGCEVALAQKYLVEIVHGPVQGGADGLGAGFGKSVGDLLSGEAIEMG